MRRFNMPRQKEDNPMKKHYKFHVTHVNGYQMDCDRWATSIGEAVRDILRLFPDITIDNVIEGETLDSLTREAMSRLEVRCDRCGARSTS